MLGDGFQYNFRCFWNLYPFCNVIIFFKIQENTNACKKHAFAYIDTWDVQSFENGGNDGAPKNDWKWIFGGSKAIINLDHFQKKTAK